MNGLYRYFHSFGGEFQLPNFRIELSSQSAIKRVSTKIKIYKKLAFHTVQWILFVEKLKIRTWSNTKRKTLREQVQLCSATEETVHMQQREPLRKTTKSMHCIR